MEVSPGRDGSGPVVRLRFNYHASDVANEFEDATETCFVRLAARFAAGEIGLDAYMDGVLAHLRRDGPRHKWDVPLEDGIADFMEMDVFAGAVKRWALQPGFVPLEEADINRFKDMAILAWTVSDPGEFDNRCRQTGLDPTSLTPELADLLLVVCYCRRHTALFTHLIKTVPDAPPQTTFDALEQRVLWNTRIDQYTVLAQHSPKAITNSSDEITLWTEILNSHWLHDPIEGPKAQFLLVEIRVTHWDTKETDASAAAGTTKLNAYFAALARRGLCYDLPSAGDFLGSCTSVQQAREFLALFPPEKMLRGGGEPSAYDSGSVIVGIADSRHADGEARLGIMELVLEGIGGLDITQSAEALAEVFMDTKFSSQVDGILKHAAPRAQAKRWARNLRFLTFDDGKSTNTPSARPVSGQCRRCAERVPVPSGHICAAHANVVLTPEKLQDGERKLESYRNPCVHVEDLTRDEGSEGDY
ncbi:hypothetical protein CkaCkLH20_11862 [Colletotrichum karsti]|uniref:Uncharacterized protein n=1 Tax=Colletotrichum karsti TaxID=1095194 RepID=A0A9P6LEX0_9PEZI|nr:uncharacterized protein CkaCkLH20_11862 [Colletotrichum karsti]KAF9870556.1 hypothetical protein CkaCkLH20_11862 [Colletotrichum karsti]